MSFFAQVGSLTVPSTTGNHSVTGLSFQPKAVIFFGNSRTADGKSTSTGTNADMPLTVLGFATDASAAVSAALASNDDFSGGDVGHVASNCIYVATGAGTVEFEASLVSLDSTGFTLGWTTASATASVVNYLALGGTDLSANIVNFTPPTATNASFAITGAGFKPTGAIFITGQAGVNKTGGLGFTDGTNQGANSSYYGGSGFHYERTTETILDYNRLAANIVSLDTDGCTIDVTEATDTGEAASVLFLGGAKVHVGTFNTLTTAGNQTITGVGFTPSAAIFSSNAEAPATTAGTSWILRTLGAADGTNQATVWASDWNNGNASLDRTHVLHFLNDDATPSDMVLASLTSFNSDGFVLDYTTVNATAREVLYLAVGASGTGGSGVALGGTSKTGSQSTGQLVTGTPVQLHGVSKTGSQSTAIPLVVYQSLQGVSLGGSKTTGTIANLPSLHLVGASKTGSKTVGTLKAVVPLAGASKSGSATTGRVSNTAFSGVSRSGSKTIGTITVPVALSGVSRSASKTTGVLKAPVALSGVSKTGGKSIASLQLPVALSGTSRSGSKTAATMAGRVSLQGVSRSASRSLASLAVSSIVALHGTSRTASRTVAIPHVAVPLAGASRSASQTTGIFRDADAFTGVSRTGSVTTGTLSHPIPVKLGGVSRSGSVSAGTIAATYPLGGVTVTGSRTVGTLSTGTELIFEIQIDLMDSSRSGVAVKDVNRTSITMRDGG